MALPSIMKHSFSNIPGGPRERSKFDRSHQIKTTINAGYLYPCFWDDILPGDTISLLTTAFGRLATPVFPIMDNIFLDFFFFFRSESPSLGWRLGKWQLGKIPRCPG